MLFFPVDGRGVALEARSAPMIRLSLLRGFELRVRQRPVPLIWSAQRVVAFLALKDKPLGRSYVAGVLWPETTSSRANANLRSSLWRAQRSCRQLITASAQHLALAPRVAVDVRSALVHAQLLLAGAATTPEDFGAGIRSDLAAELLPDWYDDWVLVEQERYRHLRLHALEAMCDRLTAAGRHGEAIDAGLAAVSAEPLRESAHRALIKAHLAEGNHWEAVRQYEMYRRLLFDELGLEPSPALRTLVPGPSLGAVGPAAPR
jgi:DNA-binding SARP family transcriptional activator